MRDRRHCKEYIVAAATAFAVAWAPPVTFRAYAQDRDLARQHFSRGQELFDRGDYRGAIAAFAEADKAAPAPLNEFNIALSYDRLGEPAEAVRRYRVFLQRMPSASNKAEVEQRIKHLERAARPTAETPPEVAPPPSGGDSTVSASGPRTATDPPNPEVSSAATTPMVPEDPELQRVAAIDVTAVAARHQEAQPPDPGGANVAPASDRSPSATPVYKKWWFWVVVGVGALVLIDLARSDSNGDSTAAGALDGSGLSPALETDSRALLRF